MKLPQYTPTKVKQYQVTRHVGNAFWNACIAASIKSFIRETGMLLGYNAMIQFSRLRYTASERPFNNAITQGKTSVPMVHVTYTFDQIYLEQSEKCRHQTNVGIYRNSRSHCAAKTIIFISWYYNNK
jgi:hypothetical protein